MSAPAYYFHGMTFCAPCALRPTRVGFIITGLEPPESMDEAIATMVMMNAVAGEDTPVPVAVVASGTCDSCGQHYGSEVTAEDGAA